MFLDINIVLFVSLRVGVGGWGWGMRGEGGVNMLFLKINLLMLIKYLLFLNLFILNFVIVPTYCHKNLGMYLMAGRIKPPTIKLSRNCYLHINYFSSQAPKTEFSEI